jgi:hypothetical protein
MQAARQLVARFGAKRDFVDANVAFRLRAERLTCDAGAMRRWRRFCSPQILLGIPKGDDEYLFALTRHKHDCILKPLVLAQVGQDAIAKECNALLRRHSGAGDPGHAREHRAILVLADRSSRAAAVIRAADGASLVPRVTVRDLPSPQTHHTMNGQTCAVTWISRIASTSLALAEPVGRAAARAECGPFPTPSHIDTEYRPDVVQSPRASALETLQPAMAGEPSLQSLS